MGTIILLFVCLFIGLAIQRVKAFPNNTHLVLNQYILYVALPAVALHYLPQIQFSWELLFPAAVAWIGFGVAYVLFNFLGKQFNWSRKLIGCLILTAGLGNTSFVGIPIVEALYGAEGMKTLILVDLPGTFIAFSTVGIWVAGNYSNNKQSSSIIKKLISFPPFIAFIIGLIMAIFQIQMPSIFESSLTALAATVSPLALISVGFQLKFKQKSKHYSYLALGLVYQLIITPLIIFGLYWGLFGKNDIATQVCIIEAAMAPMITGAILASSYGLKPQLCNMMVGFGIPISFITIGIWYWILQLVM